MSPYSCAQAALVKRTPLCRVTCTHRYVRREKTKGSAAESSLLNAVEKTLQVCQPYETHDMGKYVYGEMTARRNERKPFGAFNHVLECWRYALPYLRVASPEGVHTPHALALKLRSATRAGFLSEKRSAG